MAEKTPEGSPSAEVVGCSFVNQYYQFLHKHPNEAHRFYHDASVVDHPGPDGTISRVTTLQGINEQIMSSDYKDSVAEIKTIDAQDILQGGVIVVVTGCMTGMDSTKKSFSQTFFLAKQEEGKYYVMNDVLRFLDVYEPLSSSADDDVKENASVASPTKDLGPAGNPDPSVEKTTSVEPVAVAADSDDNKKSEENKAETAVIKPSVTPANDVAPVVNEVSNAKKEAPKVSYASILAKENTAASPAHSPTHKTVRVHANADLQSVVAPPKGLTTRDNNARDAPSVKARDVPRVTNPPRHRVAENGNAIPDGKGIYIGGLPSNITSDELRAEISKFGPVRADDGIQIRTYDDGFCFGFVEFESASSAQDAVKAHFVYFGEKEAFITFKKSASRGGGNGRRRYSPGRGRPRNGSSSDRDNGEFPSRGGYQHGGRANSVSQGRGYSGRSGEDYRRSGQRGGQRVAEQGGDK